MQTSSKSQPDPDPVLSASKLTQRVYNARKTGKSWDQIARRNNLSVAECKAILDLLKVDIHKRLKAAREVQIERDATPPPPPSYPPQRFPRKSNGKPLPVKRSAARSYPARVWGDERVTTEEQLEKMRNAYLQDLLDELNELGKR